MIAKNASKPAVGRQWGLAWVSLCLAFAVHVADEALTDFLSVWNPFVRSVHARFSWAPLPTFEFVVWLGALIAGVIVLLFLSLFVFAGAAWMRPLSYFFALVMMANGLAHIAASLYLSRLIPGVYSSPLLLVAAGFLLTATFRSGEHKPNVKVGT
jgi:hypothetical protein